jgi:hypothetical protein
MSETMQRIALAERPIGAPGDHNFRLETIEIPALVDDDVLVKIEYMSLDPYMRGRMDDAKSYASPVPIGGTMEGGAVGRVITSNSSKFAVGDYAFGQLGWASHGCLPARELRKLNPDLMPITTALGVLGMPGFTGWYGLKEHGRPKEGETLVVAAATGPVGSMVGQIAKAHGLHVVGIAGGAKKCALAVEKFSFDRCLDHKAYDDSRSMRKALQELCPNGVDIYFENVAGKTLDAILPLMNTGARIPICGMISWYNAGALGANAGDETDKLPKMWSSILVKKMSVNGFIISDHWDRYSDFLSDVVPMLASGRIAYEEDIVDGLGNAPKAFMGLLEGQNFGKLIVKVK